MIEDEQKTVDHINQMSQEAMASLWRHAPLGHPYFDKTKPYCKVFEKRFKELGGFTPAISKSIGRYYQKEDIMKFEIKPRFSNRVLFSIETTSLKLAVELAIKSGANLSGANLYGADLSGANLYGADLYGADLSGADLSRANLYGADLYGADLSGADLSRADLSRASLYGANLYRADLSGANLSGANLYGANLSGANLSGAKIKFKNFPSIRTLSSINLGKLSPAISTELMRRDAAAHPHPERFEAWANGGECPYQKEERFWIFDTKKTDWKPGKPEMIDVELIRAVFSEKGWEIEE